jgi:hypothetical protein
VLWERLGDSGRSGVWLLLVLVAVGLVVVGAICVLVILLKRRRKSSWFSSGGLEQEMTHISPLMLDLLESSDGGQPRISHGGGPFGWAFSRTTGGSIQRTECDMVLGIE